MHGRALIITMTAGLIVGRVLAAPPFFGPNDNSRWVTALALVTSHTYAIGERRPLDGSRYVDTGLAFQPGWETIDRVLDPRTGRFYSEKPPLLATIVAGESWLLHKLFDIRLLRDRTLTVRIVLLTINVVPFLVAMVSTNRLVGNLARTEWARTMIVATACLGTYVTTYMVTLNNHVVASATTMMAIYAAHRASMSIDERSQRRWAIALGLVSGLTACFELPAMLLLPAWSVWLACASGAMNRRRAVGWFLLVAAVPIAFSTLLNMIAFGDLQPAYAHREWYYFSGSYWNRPEQMDALHEPKWVYALHWTIGHNGILSLMPMVSVSIAGAIVACRDRSHSGHSLALLAGPLSIALLLFYVFTTSNYAGTSSGPRWFLWLVPFWLVAMIPAADRWAESRRVRIVVGVLLAASVASANAAADNPWQFSWLHPILHAWHIIDY